MTNKVYLLIESMDYYDGWIHSVKEVSLNKEKLESLMYELSKKNKQLYYEIEEKELI